MAIGMTPRRHVLRAIDAIFALLVRPFARAKSASSYADAGYGLLGLTLIALTLLIKTTGLLNYPIGQSIFLSSVYRYVIDKTPLKFLPPSYFLLVYLPFLLYLAALPVRQLRRPLGERFANLFFRLAELFIAAGEWCIENRGWSLSFIIVISVSLAICIARQFNSLSREQLLRSKLQYWTRLTAEYVTNDPLSERNTEVYAHLKQLWTTDFEKLSPRGFAHPSTFLNKMLHNIYDGHDNQAWNDILIDQSQRLDDEIASCAASCAIDADRDAAKTWALMNIFAGRVHARVGEDNPNATPESHFAQAKKLFNDAAKSPYPEAADFGLGLVYANSIGLTRNTSCLDPPECAWKALQAYDEGAKDAQKCDRTDRRHLNCTTDLMMRVAMRWDSFFKSGSAFRQRLQTLLGNKDKLASDLERRATELMTCKGELVATIAITAAQASAAAAALRLDPSQNGGPIDEDAHAAGFYLVLARGLEPGTPVDFSYFCPLYKSSHQPALLRAIDAVPPQFAAAIFLKQEIASACQ
jgi:hypothetical protein